MQNWDLRKRAARCKIEPQRRGVKRPWGPRRRGWEECGGSGGPLWPNDRTASIRLRDVGSLRRQHRDCPGLNAVYAEVLGRPGGGGVIPLRLCSRVAAR